MGGVAAWMAEPAERAGTERFGELLVDHLVGDFVTGLLILPFTLLVVAFYVWPFALPYVIRAAPERLRRPFALGVLAACAAASYLYYANLPADYAHSLGWRAQQSGEERVDQGLEAVGLTEDVKSDYRGPDRWDDLSWFAHGHLKAIGHIDMVLFDRKIGGAGMPRAESIVDVVIEVALFIPTIFVTLLDLLLWILIWSPLVVLASFAPPWILGGLVAIVVALERDERRDSQRPVGRIRGLLRGIPRPGMGSALIAVVLVVVLGAPYTCVKHRRGKVVVVERGDARSGIPLKVHVSLTVHYAGSWVETLKIHIDGQDMGCVPSKRQRDCVLTGGYSTSTITGQSMRLWIREKSVFVDKGLFNRRYIFRRVPDQFTDSASRGSYTTKVRVSVTRP